jgi:segregation and condensation protein B
MDELSQSGEPLSIAALVEALLFVAPSATLPAQLAAALDIPTPEIERALDELEAEYELQRQNRGIRLQRHRGRVQLVSAAESAGYIERFLGLEASSRLSRAALEALAIISYQQPVTRPQVDAIRGVSSDGVLKSLLSKGLITEAGRSEGVGRPILYQTTPEFLQYFGLNSLQQLPPLDSPADIDDTTSYDSRESVTP